MKLKIKLLLIVIFSLGIILIIGWILAQTARHSDKESAEAEMAGNIVKDIAELDRLAFEYMLHPNERVKTQFQIIYRSIGESLRDERFEYPEERAILARIRKDHVIIGDAFLQIVGEQEKPKFSKKDFAISQELTESKANSITNRSQEMSSNAFYLQDMTRKSENVFHKRAHLLIMISISVIAVTMIAVSYLFSRSVTKPIIKLYKGTELIGSGNFDFKVGTDAKDEIGQLSRAFDNMTESLKIITASRDELNRETIEHKKTHLELSSLYKVSSIITQTLDINELAPVIMDAIMHMELFNISQHKGGIFLIEDHKLRLVYSIGASQEFLVSHKDVAIGECLCGLAAKTGEIIISKNSDEDKRHTIRYPDIVPHGHIIIPLKATSGVLGVLYLYLSADSEITESEKNTLMSIGNQIGMALANAMLYEETKALSLHDSLTGLPNRRLMDILFEKNLTRARRFGSPFSIVMLDIDHFKEYNDMHGHIAGDALLADIAKILSSEVREIDIVVRYGGEEFLLLLPETALIKAQDVAERIRKAVEAKTGITISLGVTAYNKDQKQEDLIKKADYALYQAKQKGRNRVEAYG